MKKNGLIWIICGLMVIASCTGEMDNSVYQQKEIELKNFSNTGCKPGTRASGSDGSYFELEATKGNMLYVKHVNALFNCASNKFEAKVAVDGNSITVSEYDMTVSELMTTCECPFDLGYEIGPLEEGTTYSFKIITCKGPAPLYPDTHLKSLPAKGLLRYIQTCCLKLRKSPSRLSIPQSFRVHSRNRPYCVHCVRKARQKELKKKNKIKTQ